jgi:hypothetical protein
MKPIDKDIVGIFDDDRKLVGAIGKLRENNITVKDALTPFPVHDVLKFLGRESRLPYISVLTGLGAATLTFAFLYYTSVLDYPIRYGGKPIFSFPSFVIIIYLVTILLTFLGTTLAFQLRTGLYPGKDPEVLFPGSTDDKFIIIVGEVGGMTEETRALVNRILKESQADEIFEK